MVREGTAARNLNALLPMFDEPYCHRSLLVTDDRHPADILRDGHIDNVIRRAVKAVKNAVTAIQMATINAAQCFGLREIGAVAPGYRADLLILTNLDSFAVRDVYCKGLPAVINGVCQPFESPSYNTPEWSSVIDSFNLSRLTVNDFHIETEGDTCRVIGVIPGELLTDEIIMKLDFSKNNGIDTNNDILKLAVIERHKSTGHRGIGYIKGIGLKHGAIAASVSHDSHNLIVIGTNDEDMTFAANRVRELKGGSVAVNRGRILAELPLPIAGLMSDRNAQTPAQLNRALDDAVRNLGVPENISPFMNMAFVSLTVIPHIKMTTHGLVEAYTQTLKPLFVDH